MRCLTGSTGAFLNASTSTVKFIGNGSGATANATIASGAVTAVTIINERRN